MPGSATNILHTVRQVQSAASSLSFDTHDEKAKKAAELIQELAGAVEDLARIVQELESREPTP